jgi:hypothetical protein
MNLRSFYKSIVEYSKVKVWLGTGRDKKKDHPSIIGIYG